MRKLRKFLELACWITALILLVNFEPFRSSQSLCMLHWLGLEACPGCGLGHAIALALDGEFINSYNAHFMGIPVLLGLTYRICELTTKLYKTKISNYENKTDYH